MIIIMLFIGIFIGILLRNLIYNIVEYLNFRKLYKYREYYKNMNRDYLKCKKVINSSFISNYSATTKLLILFKYKYYYNPKYPNDKRLVECYKKNRDRAQRLSYKLRDLHTEHYLDGSDKKAKIKYESDKVTKYREERFSKLIRKC